MRDLTINTVGDRFPEYAVTPGTAPNHECPMLRMYGSGTPTGL
jgi:hypothetical protein